MKYTEMKKRINNKIIENRNKTIKTIKHNSNRYRYWEQFSNRVMYGYIKRRTRFLHLVLA